MIRLHCYTAATLSWSQQEGETLPLLSCVLQSGALGVQQHLAVWVGGVSQPLSREGEQEVCSWQCASEVEMEIRLSQHHQTIKAWRGWWREGTIAHVGTLPLQVFLEGQEQPAVSVSALSTAALPLLESTTLDQRNGTSALHMYGTANATAVLERPTALADPEPTLTPEGAAGEADGDLWDVDLAAVRQAVAEVPDDQTQKAPEKDAETVAVPPMLPLVTHASSQEGAVDEGAGIVTGITIAAMGARGIASRAEQERVLEQLAAVLASMPPQTILVDLRQHAQTPRLRPSRHASSRPGAALGLTKEILRGLYGARYWERGGRIPVTLRQESTRPARWRLVISDPHAEGLQELLAQLAQGVSLLILDSEATYAGSKRAAVIDFVREQCPQVTIGVCS